MTDQALPDDIDQELWFPCRHDLGARDYLTADRWHTFPGRMAAFCPTRRVSYRVSTSELPYDLPMATRYWVAGFLVGNMPRQPDVEDDSPEMAAWEAKVEQYFAHGTWPNDVHTEGTKSEDGTAQ